MSRRLLAVAASALVAALLASGCGGGANDGAAAKEPEPVALVTSVRPVPATWTTVAATLKPGLDPSSENPCQRGDRSCFDLLVEEMERRIDRLAAACDHDALFGAMYLRTTEAIRDAVDAGRFRNPEAVTHFAAWFARYYFNAFDAWHGGGASTGTDAWRPAFDAADRRAVRSLGNLLLGMNAHITRDLPVAVSETVRDPQAEVADYALVSNLLERISDRAIGELADRFDADLVGTEIPLVLGGRPTLGAVIAVWRFEAWQNGIALARAEAGERAAIASRIERESRVRADAMLPSVLYVPVIESAEQRDAYCAAQRGP